MKMEKRISRIATNFSEEKTRRAILSALNRSVVFDIEPSGGGFFILETSCQFGSTNSIVPGKTIHFGERKFTNFSKTVRFEVLETVSFENSIDFELLEMDV